MDVKKELLEILQQNARAKTADIALMLGVGEDEVRVAREEMEREGIIVGYNAQVDWNKFPDEVQAVIEVRITPQRERGFDAVASRISAFEEVSCVTLMSGGYDLMVTVDGRDMRQVALFVAEKLSTLEGVLSTATHFVLRKYKENGRTLGGGTPGAARQVVS